MSIVKKIAIILGSILGMLLVLFLGFAFFIKLAFGPMWNNTVVDTVHSPENTYYAEVIDSSQGAMGGNTFVDVHKTEGKGSPQRVYSGDWGEYEDMEIYWKDDTCLVINGVEYEIE